MMHDDDEEIAPLGEVLAATESAVAVAAKEHAARLMGTSPPQDLDAERALLSCALIQGRRVVEGAAEAGLAAEHFYLPQHRRLWQVLDAMAVDDVPIDTISVVEQLRQRGMLEKMGGVAGISGLTASYHAHAEAMHYARSVWQKAELRAALEVLTRGVERILAQRESAPLILERVETELMSARAEGMRSAGADRAAIVAELFDSIGKEPPGVISTPLKDLNTMLGGGLKPGQMIVVGARPSMGKTALAAQLMSWAEANHGTAVLSINAEMPPRELIQREFSARTGLGMSVWRNATPRQREQLWAEAGHVAESRVALEDGSGMSAGDVTAMVRRYVSREHVGLVVIDYLQLLDITGERDTDSARIAEMTRALKKCAIRCNVPLVLLSQLNRKVEERADRRPGLGDLRDSGGIESDADVILFPQRPHRWWPKDPRFMLDEGLEAAEVIVAKNRNGPVGSIDCAYHQTRMSFLNLG